MVVLRAIALALVLGACGSKEPRGGGPTCEERAARMETRLRSLADEPGGAITAPSDLTPIESPDGQPIDTGGPVVEVRRDGSLAYFGKRVVGTSQLARELALEREFARHPSPYLYVLADRDAPAAAIAAVIAIATPQTPRLAVLGPARPAEPYDEALRTSPAARALAAELDGDAAQRATRLAKTIETVVADCTPLIRLYGQIAAEGDKGDVLARGTPRAMRECRCTLTDPDLFEYALLKIFGAFDRPMRWVPLDEVPPDARTAADLAR